MERSFVTMFGILQLFFKMFTKCAREMCPNLRLIVHLIVHFVDYFQGICSPTADFC